jgi:AraC family transcriptional regulator of arabinose operon
MHTHIPGAIYHERFEIPSLDTGARLKWFGKVRHASDEILPLQVHGNYEFSLMIEGSAVITVNGCPYTLRAGDLLFTKPGEQHMMTGDGHDDWTKVYLGVDRIEPPELDLLFRASSVRFISGCSDLLPDFERILDEARHQKQGMACMIQWLISAWLMEVSRRLSAIPSSDTRCDYAQIVLDACSYIELHANHDLSLNEVAQAVSISKSRLAHVFADQMDMSVGDFIRQLVMQRALRHLEDRRLNVSEIAESLGFPALSSFSAAFRRYWGVSPVQYQQNLNANRP